MVGTLILAVIAAIAFVVVALVALGGPLRRRRRAAIERYMRREHAATRRRRTIRDMVFGHRRRKRITFQVRDTQQVGNTGADVAGISVR